MSPISSRTLLLAGLAIILVLIVLLGFGWVMWGWPPFEVRGFSWS